MHRAGANVGQHAWEYQKLRFHCRFHRVTRKSHAGQGVEVMEFRDEQRELLKMLAEECKLFFYLREQF